MTQVKINDGRYSIYSECSGRRRSSSRASNHRLESMKMEIPIEAETAGKVTAINAQVGDFVNEEDVLGYYRR